MTGDELRSRRLLLRRWRPADREPFAALNADPVVMAFMPALLSRAESDALAERIEAHFETHGFGLWALEVVGGAPFIGFAGLNAVDFQAPFAPAIEIGWRLDAAFWGRGYATEAAAAAAAYAFGCCGLSELVAFTVPANRRSIAVMKRLGMTHDAADDFDHPGLPEGHALRRHVLYRLCRGGVG
jgi:ribosomal-protein-alanine N-acetyltransferase